MTEAIYTKKEFTNLSSDFKIGAIISDGMWYTIPKWRKLAAVEEEELREWIDKHLESGELLISDSGESYRLPLPEIEKWYRRNGISLDRPLVNFLFPPRIWDGMTETEGFLSAPLRDVGVATFVCKSPRVKFKIAEKLRGIAVVRDFDPKKNKYKAYGLSASYIKNVINSVKEEHEEEFEGKVHTRAEVGRRDLKDFTPEFSRNILWFYTNFGKSLTRGVKETIEIFLPTEEEQEAKMLEWTIDAIEKFDEKLAVPFSGYFDTVLKRWPYDLPEEFLGRELAIFQREKSRAIKALREDTGEESKAFSSEEISLKMGIPKNEFVKLEEQHKNWLRSRNPVSLTWDENGEEKSSRAIGVDYIPHEKTQHELDLAHALSIAVVKTAISSREYSDAFAVISQMDNSEINFAKIESISDRFIQELAMIMGIEGGGSGV